MFNSRLDYISFLIFKNFPSIFNFPKILNSFNFINLSFTIFKKQPTSYNTFTSTSRKLSITLCKRYSKRCKKQQHTIQGKVKGKKYEGKLVRQDSFLPENFSHPSCFEASNTPKKPRQFWKSTFSNVTSFTAHPRGSSL